MTVLIIMTGICAVAVLFMLRFFVALCRERKPGHPVHRLTVVPAPVGGDHRESGEGEATQHVSLADHHALRRRHAMESPTGATGGSAIGVACSAKWRWTKGPPAKGRYSS